MEEKQRQSFVSWAESQAISFDSNRPDFDFLLKRLNGVRLISFGESQHYTKEFNQIQVDMFKELALRGEVAAFAYESPFADSRLVYDYVLGADVDARDVFFEGICFMFSVWKEMRELAEWMREYNLSHPDGPKLRYYGIDIGSCDFGGNSAYGPVLYLTEYLRKVDPDWAKEAEQLLNIARNCDMFCYSKMEIEERNAFSARVLQLYSHVEKRETIYTELTGREDYAWALQSAKNALYSVACLTASAQAEPACDVNSVRELCMADNLRWVLQQEQSRGRTIFHSHNVHIRKTVRSNGTVPAGAYLREWLDPREMLVICATNERSLRLDDCPATDSLEHLLSQVKKESYFLDWRDIPREQEQILASICKDRQNMGYMDNAPRIAYDMVYFTKKRQELSEITYRPYDAQTVKIKAPDTYAGVFRLRRCWWAPAPGEKTDILTISVENGRVFSCGMCDESGNLDLVASSAEHFPVEQSEMYPLSETTYYWKNWFGRLEFIREEDGRINRVEFTHYDTKYGNIIADRIR